MAKVIVFRGKAGVEKTTISTVVSKKMNIPIIRKDDIYDSIAGYVEDHELRNSICYEVLLKIVETNLFSGLDVIVDAGFHRLEDILQFKDQIQIENTKVVSLLCICSDENIWAARVNERRLNPRPNNLITDFKKLRLHYKSLKTDALEGEKVLDTVDSLNNLVTEAILEISKY